LLSLRPLTLPYAENWLFRSEDGQNVLPEPPPNVCASVVLGVEDIVGKTVLGTSCVDEPKILFIIDLDLPLFAVVVVGLNASVVVVTGCVLVVLPESIFCDITLPSLSTVTVLVITAGTLI
jgi:hypothetical protein